MKLWTVLATWAPLVILAIGLVCAARAAGAETPPPSTAEDAKPTFRYNTVKFTVSGATEETYDEFRGKMLNKLTGGVSYQEISVMRNPSTVPLSQRFILVQLSNYAEQNITLAVDVTNVHVVGYLSSPNHFWYFNDAPQPQISQLFPGSVRNPLGFGGSYVDLHRVARQNREQIPLSMASLDQAITTLHLTSKATTDKMKSVARSLLVCTQMVSEAIRFAYIEDMVLENIGSQYIPDPQVISYEQNWVALSRAIQAGDGKHLKPPVKLLDTKGKPYTVTLVYDLAGPLSLMLFAKPKAD